MKRLALVLVLLAGCATPEPECRVVQRCCSQGFPLNLVSVDGKTISTCNHWCVGRQISKACACTDECTCKR